ncbi:hypothetical protein KQX54_000744 [Cotesia glomerata]|uniref:DNA polymerase alpha subunit B N-terminal domain-containing protein n=1 Tax=Cotesia glomerata TaxID=32391 RepID=A0AAV7I3W5_COTGL|nr:hypothetical protein KQX54_000744 [Cotesia glomerata]
MEFEEKLRENFKLFECKIVDESVLTKFVEIYKDFEVDEDGIAESWVEFVNRDENEPSSTDITTEKVEAFEAWFKKNIDKRCAKPDLPSDSGTESTAEELSNLDRSIKNKGSEILERSILNVLTIKTEEDDDILEMYGRKKNPSKITSLYLIEVISNAKQLTVSDKFHVHHPEKAVMCPVYSWFYFFPDNADDLLERSGNAVSLHSLWSFGV